MKTVSHPFPPMKRSSFRWCLIPVIPFLLGGFASALTVVNIAGEALFRGSVHSRIQAMLPGGAYAYYGTGSAGAGLDSADQAIFTGVYQGETYVIRTSWLRPASAAMLSLKNGKGSPLVFLPSDIPQAPGGLALEGPGNAHGVPDIIISDLSPETAGVGPLAVDDHWVGVVPYVWLANQGAPAALANMTPQLVENLYSKGGLPLSFFTAEPADRSARVFPLGMPPFAGARVTAMIQSNLEVGRSVMQYQPVVSGREIVSHVPWPQGAHATGDGGFPVAGTAMADVMACSSSSSQVGGYYVGYASAKDLPAGSSGAKVLSWNGVAYSVQAVQQGSYTFWSYEHCLFPTALGGKKRALALGLKSELLNQPGSAAILRIGDMKVSRSSDGLPPVNDY